MITSFVGLTGLTSHTKESATDCVLQQDGCAAFLAPERALSSGTGRPLEPSNVNIGLVRRGEEEYKQFVGVKFTDFSQNYVVTLYAAEIVNTLTNLLFMYLASKGIRNCLKYGHDTVFLVAFIGYVLVGTGSFLFHATLKCKPE